LGRFACRRDDLRSVPLIFSVQHLLEGGEIRIGLPQYFRLRQIQKRPLDLPFALRRIEQGWRGLNPIMGAEVGKDGMEP
jgi:hypothetical protein